MIVDVHTHIPTHETKVPEPEMKLDTSMKSGGVTRLTNSVEDYLETFKNIDKTFVFGIAPRPWKPKDSVLGTSSGWPKEYNHNDIASKLASYAPEKIIPFMSLHPLDPKVNEEYDRCVKILGCKGIKLGPNYQDFPPDCEEAFRLYSRLEKDSLPIIFHQGTSPIQDAPLMYAHPQYIDKIAMAFPNLKIILAHLAHPWQIDCLSVVRKHKNVWADVSAQFYRPWSFWNGIRLFYEWGVTEKIFFGSDWPVTTPEETIEGLLSLEKFALDHHLPEIPKSEIEGIINRNTIEILGVS